MFSENGGFSPQIIHFNRGFHYFHHPFWGPPLFSETTIFHVLGQESSSSREMKQLLAALERLLLPVFHRSLCWTSLKAMQNMRQKKSGMFIYIWILRKFMAHVICKSRWIFHTRSIDLYMNVAEMYGHQHMGMTWLGNRFFTTTFADEFLTFISGDSKGNPTPSAWTIDWVVVSSICYFHLYLGKILMLTNIFQFGWNHQLVELQGKFWRMTHLNTSWWF